MTPTQQEKRKILAHYQTQEKLLKQELIDNSDISPLEVLLSIAHQRNIKVSVYDLNQQGRAV
jgi:hypothetical protein